MGYSSVSICSDEGSICGRSLHLADNIVTLGLFLLLALFSLILVLLQASIALADDTLDGAELAGLLCNTHIVE